MELAKVGGYLRGQVVMVTGAGGSIGSELSRQIARVGPAKLVLVDHAEQPLRGAPRAHRRPPRERRGRLPVLADCREEERMREVFAEHQPTTIFHAAAYKHVGLMEENPVEGRAQQLAGHPPNGQARRRVRRRAVRADLDG